MKKRTWRLAEQTEAVRAQSKGVQEAGEFRRSPTMLLVACLVGLVFANGCSVGPKYARPAVQTPPGYKELTPANFPQTDGWKVAQPADATLSRQVVGEFQRAAAKYA